MSRLPPLPPGLPPRPQYPPPSSYGAESYRPRDDYHRQEDNRPSYPPRGPPPPYQFRGNDGYDSRSDYGRRSPPRRRSPPGRRSPPRNGYPSGDAYRPREDNFSFRHDAPPGVDFSRADVYRPRSPPLDPYRSRDDQPPRYPRDYVRHNENSRSRGGRPGRAGYRGRGGSRRAADRDFLQTNRAPTPELMSGIDEDKGNGVRYRAMDEMSVSDEDENDDTDGPRKKRARSDAEAADGNSVPQWSNPDPYTALPPPDESQRKKKDVVKLIRKARVTDGADGSTKPGADSDDFISFDFDDDVDEPKHTFFDRSEPVPSSSVPINTPTGPKASAQRTREDHPPRPVVPESLPSAKTDPVKISMRKQLPDKPMRNAAAIDLSSDPALGNRKRTHQDEIKLEAPRELNNSFGGRKAPSHGGVVSTWQPLPGTNSTPWIELDHSNSANMGLWMHKEIVDFYHYVKPRAFEQAVRTKLVEDLRSRAKQRFPNYDIMTFGSFPAGLYLPTSDMDLVCVSKEFMRSGRILVGSRHLFEFAKWLKTSKIAHDGSVTTVPKAKVPLVKYVDRLTGLKIDISFENDTGLIANKTFQAWKQEFPAMPTLVTIIKHLLAMRGLNEPQNGGIGGFSVICLVVSLLQHMPQVQSRSMIAEHHYGEILMEFFDLYGNQFNVQTTAISLNPPAYVPKDQAHNIVYKRNNMDKFSIIDPNKPDNDISGGASNTRVILTLFSDAHSKLQKRMGQLQSQPERAKESILGCILAGNYRSFDIQRSHLATVHEQTIGPVQD